MSILVEGYFKKEKILIELEGLDLQNEEKIEIIKMADELAELRLLDSVLEKLEERDKELFLEQMHGGSTEIVAEFLRERIKNIEGLLLERARSLEDEIVEDIRSLRSQK
ncbi:MAG: hypothetical protein A2Z11_04915 [Candidatus Woykebacteria bacterium RBG_16_43_9]|uniref:Uncharacterized protein n=1 Tax=Candidatus Woykebacteria bacterium RBG_16_43_9 TaxID=1802596 RepID=A0A1G1WEE3_9BACT|nr:MAG: hypothetical protein A2Z11_04915 [Candidatus Woykebacteria bacterium RBG_16_43_9]